MPCQVPVLFPYVVRVDFAWLHSLFKGTSVQHTVVLSLVAICYSLSSSCYCLRCLLQSCIYFQTICVFAAHVRLGVVVCVLSRAVDLAR